MIETPQTSYSNPRFSVEPRVAFDPSNHIHMADYARFVRTGNWVEGCRYFLDDPYTDIPTSINAKIVAHVLDQYKYDPRYND